MSVTGGSSQVAPSGSEGAPAATVPERAPSGTAMFATVARRRRGYHKGQVDAFVDAVRTTFLAGPEGSALSSRTVRDAVFDVVRGGYEPEEVDAALDRFEDAFAQWERAGAADLPTREELTHARGLIRGRLGRADGHRFRAPSGRRPGYRAADVDALCRDLRDWLDETGTGQRSFSTSLSPSSSGTAEPDDEFEDIATIRDARFTADRGADAYDAAQVDLFLDRVIEVLRAEA